MKHTYKNICRDMEMYKQELSEWYQKTSVEMKANYPFICL